MILWELFTTFFIIGLFNFGGGGAMIALIQTQVVDLHGWISEGDFTDIVAISQSTPGPIGINCATYVGYQVGGIPGSFITTMSIVLPSFLVFLALVRIVKRFHENRLFTGTMKMIKPVVCGLMLAAAVILTFRIDNGSVGVIRENFPDWKSWMLFAAAFALSYFKKVNPIYLILSAGLFGLILW